MILILKKSTSYSCIPVPECLQPFPAAWETILALRKHKLSPSLKHRRRITHARHLDVLIPSHKALCNSGGGWYFVPFSKDYPTRNIRQQFAGQWHGKQILLKQGTRRCRLISHDWMIRWELISSWCNLAGTLPNWWVSTDNIFLKNEVVKYWSRGCEIKIFHIAETV